MRDRSLRHIISSAKTTALMLVICSLDFLNFQTLTLNQLFLSRMSPKTAHTVLKVRFVRVWTPTKLLWPKFWSKYKDKFKVKFRTYNKFILSQAFCSKESVKSWVRKAGMWCLKWCLAQGWLLSMLFRRCTLLSLCTSLHHSLNLHLPSVTCSKSIHA